MSIIKMKMAHMMLPSSNRISPEQEVSPPTTSFYLFSRENVVAAEYLAKGYTLSDDILKRAIEIDRAYLIPQRIM
jgi:hypothetical protein